LTVAMVGTESGPIVTVTVWAPSGKITFAP
jgi:hypothetical protein